LKLTEKRDNLSEYRGYLDSLKATQKSLKEKVSSYELLKEKVKGKTEQLIKVSTNINSYNKHLERIHEVERKLSELNPFTFDTEEIKREIEERKKMFLKYQYIILNHHEYHVNKQNIANTPKILSALNQKWESAKFLKEKRNRILKKIDSSILESDSGVLVNLLSNVKGISEYLKHNHHDNVCPVCSSVIKDGLEKSVIQNLTNYNIEFDKSSKYAEKLLQLKSKITSNIRILESRIKKCDIDISAAKRLYDLSEKNIKVIENNSLFDINIMSEDLAKLKEVQNVYNTDLNNFNKIFELLFDLNQLRSDNRFFGNKNNTFSSLEDVDKRIGRLNRANRRIENRLFIIKKEISSDSTINYLDELLRKFIDFVKKFDIQPDKSFVNIETEISNRIFKEENKINIISQVNNAMDVINQNSHIQNQINSLLEEKQTISNFVDVLSVKIDSLSQYINNVFGDFGDSAKDFLNSYNSPIQKYFRYLNPLPNRSSIRFEGEGENLYIKVLFDENDEVSDITSPKNVLSSGQLNVLAISVFLAINASQKIHELDFIAIDDPIQNMDNINQFSICDVLGSIKKQLIFSTHDFDFLKLFIKKNEHQRGKIQVYNLNSPYLINERVEHILLE
jgi:DNA repair protein SbcC/Rad50